MATYEAYVTLGAMSVAVSTVDVPLTVRSETADVAAPAVLLTLLMPASHGGSQQQPNIRLLRKLERSPGECSPGECSPGDEPNASGDHQS